MDLEEVWPHLFHEIKNGRYDAAFSQGENKKICVRKSVTEGSRKYKYGKGMKKQQIVNDSAAADRKMLSW